MAGYIVQKIGAHSWKILDRKTNQEFGVLARVENGFKAESERLKMKAEALDPWLILRMVFNTEEFHLDGVDGQEPQRLTTDNIRQLLGVG
jgi:hypothetical protein